MNETDTQAAPLRVRVKPLDLSAILRDAFLSGRGVTGRLSDEDQAAWVAYDPEPLPAYQRISAALAALPPESPAQQPATDAVDRHYYWPSVMHMGDCSVCGNSQDHPNHIGTPGRTALSQSPAKAGDSLQQRPAAEEKRP